MVAKKDVLDGQRYLVVRAKLPPEINDFSERDVKWLFMFLTGDAPDEKYHDLVAIIVRKLERRGIKICEKYYSLNHDEIRELRGINVLSDIAWIQKDDHRLLIWLLNVLKYKTRPNRNFLLSEKINIESISTEKRYDRVVEYIDAVFFDDYPSDKKNWLADLKVMWANSMTPDSGTKWVDAKNIEQLKWAWKYLKDKSSNAQLAMPVTPDEYYHAILASLDGLFCDEPDKNAEKTLFINAIKKAWAQQKHRLSGKTKKLYHLPLTIKAKEALEKLAIVKDCTESEVLEKLINREYVETCLNAQGKDKY